MSQYITVRDFIEEFRLRWGDTTCDANDKMLIAFLNTGLRRLAREKGIEKLFKFRDTFELASIRSDGQPSSEWRINGVINSEVNGEEVQKCIGAILDIYHISILGDGDCTLLNQTPCYLGENDFFLCNPTPDSNIPGNPGEYTITQFGGTYKIVFDRPIAGPKTAMVHYSAVLPRLKSLDDIIRLPWSYMDIIVEMVLIYAHMESADYTTSRALYEDVDTFIDDLREILARNPTGVPFRKMRRSF